MASNDHTGQLALPTADELLADDDYWAAYKATTIQDIYRGDALAYQLDLDESLLEAVSWQDIAAGSAILPELAEAAQALITRCLGYLPHEATRLSHEPFLRALVQQHRSGLLSATDFEQQATETIKLIRNQDMRVCAYPTYSPAVCARYDSFLPEYRERARARLVGFLGYVPTVPHSWLAELWLRTLLAHDHCQLPAQETALDRRAMTIVRYREVLAISDKQAADASPLLGNRRNGITTYLLQV